MNQGVNECQQLYVSKETEDISGDDHTAVQFEHSIDQVSRVMDFYVR